MIRNVLMFCLLLFLVASPQKICARESEAGNIEEKILLDFLWQEVVNMPKESRPKIALVFSGGGARGFSYIGALRVFEENKVPIDIVVGASVGSIIGALYADGVPLEKLEYMSTDMGWNKLVDISKPSMLNLILSQKLLSTEKMERYLRLYLGNKSFYELKRKFACVAVDITSGEKIIFTEGDVAMAVRASATIPGLFEPVSFRHRLLVDGGLVDNIPVDIAKSMGADIVIVFTARSDFTKNVVDNVFKILIQAIYIQGSLLENASLKKADIVISPDVKDVSAVDLSRGGECINAGIVEANKRIDEIKKFIIEKTFFR